MKKLSYLLLGAAGLMMVSCSQDDLENPALNGDGNYNITVKLPGDFRTRAFSDGSTADNLHIAIYDAADNALIDTKDVTFNGEISTVVPLTLVNGRSYKIAFFAQSPASQSNGVYTFDATAKEISVNYAAMNSDYNTDAYDCFYQLHETGKIGTDTQNTTVLLNRPVAQVNWGTDDLNDPAVTNDKVYGENASKLVSKVSAQAYTTFDMMTGDVKEGSTKESVALNYLARPASTEKFPVVKDDETAPKYEYLSMHYLLIPKSSDVIDLELTVNNDETSTDNEHPITVASAPVQANYRTNIYGSLLTNPTNYTVIKNQDWNGQDYNLPYENMIKPGLYLDEESKTYTIMTVDGLKAYSAITNAVSDKNGGLNKYTVLLGADLDMAGVTDYVPLWNCGAKFDGQDHTVYNMTVNNENNAGFMASAIGYVSNLNFVNATVTGNYKAGVLAADGMCARIDNVKVKGAVITVVPHKVNGKYDDANNIGGIVGYLSAESNASVENCVVEDAEISAYRKVGGLVGYANGKCVVENNKVINTNVYAIQLITDYDGYPKAFDAGQIVGGHSSNFTLSSTNTADNVNVSEVRGSTENPKQVEIDSPEGLNILNILTPTEYAGKTFTYTGGDIDMKGDALVIERLWSPENKCTLDFGGATISNVTLTSDKPYIFKGGTVNVKNLNVKDVKCTTNTRFAGVIQNIYGDIEEVHVDGIEIISTEGRVGGIVGIHNGGKMINCSVKNAVLQGTWSVGGLSGAINETPGITYTNCTVDNVQVTNTKRFGGVYDTMVGVMTGNVNTDNVAFSGTITNCGDHVYPIDYSFNDYTWNGAVVKANIDNSGKPIQ